MIEAYVPISLIYTEDVPVDIKHVEELADSIREEAKLRPGLRTGQLSPILLGEVRDFKTFPIIDGFHRASAIKLIGNLEAFSTIRPQSSWEEIIDHRILAAATHRVVRFSRLIEWIEASWSYSPWVEMLRPIQAFQLGFSKTMTGARLGLTGDDVEAIRKWVSNKCEHWHVSPGLIYKNLSIARVADPELVKQARERKGGSQLEAITPQHLQAIATILPYRYDLQKLLADAAKAHTLTVARTRALAVFISNANSTVEAQTLIESGAWETLYPVYSPISHEAERELKPLNNEGLNSQTLIDQFFQDELRIARLIVENAILAGRYIPSAEEKKNGGNDGKAAVSESKDEPNDILPVPELEENPESSLTSEQLETVFQKIDEMRPDLTNFLFRVLQVRLQDSEDIISDAILKVWKYAQRGKMGEQYLEDKRLKALMVKVVNYSRVDWFRKLHGRKGNKVGYFGQTYLSEILPSDDGKELTYGDRLSYEEEGFNDAEQDEYKQRFRYVLPQLTEYQRIVLVMKTYFELGDEDIGQILGKEPATVASVFVQTKQKLLKILTV